MSNRTAYADTSIFIYLYEVGQLHLLCRLFDKVFVPRKVIEELRRDSIETIALLNEPCLELISRLPDEPLIDFGLDPGETAVLSYALNRGGHYVLMDDGAARRMARILNLKPVGILGLLLEAKQLGLLPAVRPLADAAIAAGYRISPAFYQTFLRDIGEGD